MRYMVEMYGHAPRGWRPIGGAEDVEVAVALLLNCHTRQPVRIVDTDPDTEGEECATIAQRGLVGEMSAPWAPSL